MNTWIKEQMSIRAKIYTLEKTICIWYWLKHHPGRTKTAAYASLGLPSDVNDCPLCQYATRGDLHDNVNCHNCLLKDFWPGESKDPYDPICLNKGSAFSNWCKNYAMTHASRIHKAAIRKLKEVRLKLQEVTE